MTDWRERRLGAYARPRQNKPDKTVEAAPAASAPAPIIFVLRVAAQNHAETALEALATLVKEASSEHVRVSAANAILDRAFGKPLTGVQAAEDEADEEDDEIEIRWLGEE